MNSSPNFSAARSSNDSAALEYLAATVNRLVRAERRQSLTHFSLAGLFWGIAAACVAVLAIRLQLLAVSAAHATTTCVLIGLAVGLAIGWVTRRSPLAVAILADVRLNLKQRLSSAWELYESDKQSATAADISRQLQKSRTPVAEHVFPLSRKTANAQYTHPGVRWGPLIPAVALLLLLLNTLDFGRFAAQRTGQIDREVQREGKTLRTYSASMALRARNDSLEASSQMAETMRQLGRRMEAGTLARGPALKRLKELRHEINNVRQSLKQQLSMVPRNGADGAASDNEHSRASSVIESAASQLGNGRALPNELRDNPSLQRALATANINQEDFHKALQQAHNGDPLRLEKMLQELRNEGRTVRDTQELDRAYERVQSIRETLGAQSESGSSVSSRGDRGSHADDDFALEDSDLLPGENSDAANFVFRDQGRPAGRARSPDNSQTDVAASSAEQDQPAVQLNGKIGEGQAAATQTRTVPTAGSVNTPIQSSGTDQQRQLEAILSKDTLPSHQKAYVRRYFLELSRAVNVAPPAVDKPAMAEPNK